MLISLPYGPETSHASFDTGHCLGALDVAEALEIPDIENAVHQGLDHPIGSSGPALAHFKPGQSVTIIVSDIFRRTCMDQVLPVLLKRLNQAGIQDESIQFLVATGTHRAPTPEEQARILGPAVYERFAARVFVHDPDDPAQLVLLGTTSRGTPVEINRRAVESDHVLLTGAVVLHYFGGFGGGRKSIVPGIASRKTIAHNHAMNLDPIEDRLNPAVQIGALDGNPVAEDMLEAARFLPVAGILNTVLNRAGRIAGLFCGELDAAHRAASAFARQLFAVQIPKQADLVIACAPGAKNFVQSHKALFNAWQALKPGGRIIFLNPCPEGLGGDAFVKWLRLGDRARVFEGLRRQSEINGQTALSTLEKMPLTHIITSLSEEQVNLLHGRKSPSLQAALDNLRPMLPPDPEYYLMPSAEYTVPFCPIP